MCFVPVHVLILFHTLKIVFANLGVARDTFSAGVDNYISPTYITGSAVYLYGDSKYKLSSSGFEAGSRYTKEFQFKTKIVEF